MSSFSPRARSRRGLAGLVTSLAVLCCFGSAAPAIVPGGGVTAGAFQPAGPSAALSLGNGTVDSLNWAGYAVTPGSGVTAVRATFVVPSAGLLPPGFSATWTGIGGYNTTDLIQAGVGEQSLPSAPVLGPQYFAWYEILPAAETPLSGCSGDANCTVKPGDSISVEVHNVRGNTWNIQMADAGHWTYSHDLTYASSESSAEWIQEAPTLIAVQTIPAPVGTVHFRPTSTYTARGASHPIGAGSPTRINESLIGLVNEATTSPLGSDGQSFNVCVYAQTCAAP
ncbi:MAG: hypothetical protein J2P57_22705 [Acidimicrobiaceae bacterium]|nr:hypothetical protein [Acidimicrobiaceae bacterium]